MHSAQLTRKLTLFSLGLFTLLLVGRAAAADIKGRVLGGDAPIGQSTVTLFAASTGAPKQLAQTKTDSEGRFEVNSAGAPPDSSLYLVATGGIPAARKAEGNNPAIALMAVVGTKPPGRVVINEFTTIASVVTHAQFIDDTTLKGSALALRIAAGNVPNLVDLETGGYGATIQDGINSAVTPTLANFSTLANVLAGCVTRVRADACSKLFAATTPPSGGPPSDTLLAAEVVAFFPWHQPEKVFALLNDFYPVPKGKVLRATPFMPYLTFSPSAWVFPLRFTGGGYNGGGKLMIDSQGNVLVGDNFLVGAQNQSTLWSGNVTKFAPNGHPLSRMTSGFTGGGVVGVGFGLAIDAHDDAWVDTYAGKAITRFTNSGKPLSPSDGYNFNGQLGEMQGIIVTPNGDLWAVDQGKSQLVHVPQADPAKGRIYCQNASKDPFKNSCGLFAPFHLAIDQQDRIWLTNNIGSDVIRFHVSDPTKVEKFKVGYGQSGLAIDSQGNVWVTNRFGSSERGRAKLDEMMAAYAVKGEKAATEVMVHGLSGKRLAL